MQRDTEKTTVVFRVWKDTGDVLALFPDLRETNGFCTSYMHVGQHSHADYTGCIQATRPARRAEYADLQRELENMGYNLRVRARRTF